MNQFRMNCKMYIPVKHRNFGRKICYSGIEIEEMGKEEKRNLIIMYVALLIVVLSALSLIVSRHINAAPYATHNTLTEQLISGTFDTRDGRINNEASNFFTKMAGKVFEIALPFMSAFALTMITLSLISSIIYLTKPDLFNEVHDLVQERKGNKAGGRQAIDNMIELYRQKGLRDFVLSYCIDFKSWAFQDAVTAGIDGEPTFQDFFRNMPKYIAMFTFCILITNRVLLDFLMTGAQLTASLAEKITYDYNYVEIMEGFIDQGKRYTPQQWTGKSREDANKMSTYRSIYNTVIANLEMEQKDTESLQTIGLKIEEYMERHIIPLEHWDRKVFSARTMYLPARRSEIDVPGTYYIPGEQIGMVAASGNPGFIALYVRSETDDGATSNVGTTRYPGAWGQGTPPTEFDLNEVPGVRRADGTQRNVTFDISAGTVLVVTADGKAYNARMDVSGASETGIIKIDYSGIEDSEKARIRTVTLNSIKAYTITRLNNQEQGGHKQPITLDKPVWVNPAAIPRLEDQ